MSIAPSSLNRAARGGIIRRWVLCAIMPMKPARWLLRALWSAVVVLAMTGFGAAALRTSILTGLLRSEALVKQAYVIAPKIRPPQAAPTNFEEFEARYAQHAGLMLLHVVPGMLFMVLGPLQFIPQIRARHIRLHRWSGRVFLVSGAVIGISALALCFRMPLISGANEAAATLLFGSLFLFALGKAYLHIRRLEIAHHREWMIRAFAIGLGIAMDRPVVSLFFAFSAMPVSEFFGIALWLCFSSLFMAGEAWINYTRREVSEAAAHSLKAVPLPP